MKLKKKLLKLNKGKVRNATPNEYNGIKFRSKLETYTYKKLLDAGIYSEYEKHRFELLPAFKFQEKNIRNITYLPDFVGNDFIIECKGYPNDSWKLREKLFKYAIKDDNTRVFYIVHTLKEVDELINILKK